VWLVSDARRLPDPRAAAARLPRGAGVLARDLAPGLLRPLAAIARRRGLVLAVAGDGRAALGLRIRLGAGTRAGPGAGLGLHLPDRRPATGLLPVLLARRGGGGPILSVAAHGMRGMARARRLRADLVILSPVFPTASHPGAPALGPLRWGGLARRAGRPVVAMGGVNPGNIGRLPRAAWGWAAVGLWAGRREP